MRATPAAAGDDETDESYQRGQGVPPYDEIPQATLTADGDQIEASEQVIFASFPVTVTQLPVTVTQLPATRCQIGHRTVAYRPGSPSEVLTEHCRRSNPKCSASRPG